MARHALKGKRVPIPREFRGHAAHRAVSYGLELAVVKLVAFWVFCLVGPRPK